LGAVCDSLDQLRLSDGLLVYASSADICSRDWNQSPDRSRDLRVKAAADSSKTAFLVKRRWRNVSVSDNNGRRWSGRGPTDVSAERGGALQRDVGGWGCSTLNSLRSSPRRTDEWRRRRAYRLETRSAVPGGFGFAVRSPRGGTNDNNVTCAAMHPEVDVASN